MTLDADLIPSKLSFRVLTWLSASFVHGVPEVYWSRAKKHQGVSLLGAIRGLTIPSALHGVLRFRNICCRLSARNALSLIVVTRHEVH